MEVVREAPLREHERHLGRHTHRAPPDGIRIAHQMDVQKVELRLLARGRIRDKVLHGRTQLERRPGLSVHVLVECVERHRSPSVAPRCWLLAARVA